MCKRMVCAVMMCLAVSSVVLAVGGDMGGSDPNGSPEAPYLIEDFDDFTAFCNSPAYHAGGVHTRLTDNLNLSHIAYAGGAPIAFYSGVFDGGNHTVYGLYVSGMRQCGLFGDISGTPGQLACVQNLVIDDAEIVSDAAYNGVLAGSFSPYVTIENVHVTNSSVTSPDCSLIGGLAGWVGSTAVTEPIGTIRNCSVTDTYVAGGNATGGLIGAVMSVSIQNCYARCTVEAIGFYPQFGIGVAMGGLVGDFRGRAVNCYADSQVTGEEMVGGLIGYNDQAGVINCYAAGNVTGTTDVGGLCGYVVTTGGNYEDTGNFWDTQMTQCATSAMGSPATTAGMMTLATFTGWDFTHDWMMLREGEDYPRLQWQLVYTGDIAGLYGVNIADVAYLSRYWLLDDCGGADDCGRADIDSSGDVGLTDLEAITNDWLQR